MVTTDGLLDPATLYQMGYDLVREGETVWLLEAGTRGLRLLRASTGTDVYQGGAARESWTYRLTLPGPSTTTTVRASADQVIHIRQNSDPTNPWRGRILESEVSRVLERPVRLTHHQLASADVASKARAFKALVENEIDRERALTLVGWS